MIQIEIVDEKVYERSYTDPRKNKTINFRTQKAFAFLPEKPYPVEFNLQLWDHPAFAKGMYNLSDISYKIDKYGNLGLKSNLSLDKIQ